MILAGPAELLESPVDEPGPGRSAILTAPPVPRS